MKKILGIVVLGLLLSGNAYAEKTCGDEIDWSANKNGTSYEFEFKSTSTKTIYITKLQLDTSSGQEMKSSTNKSRGYLLSVRPFGLATYKVNTSGLNPDIVKSSKVALWCTYTQPTGTFDYSKYNKKKESWFKWWYLIFAIPILGLIIQASEDKDKKKSNKTSSATPSKASSTKSSTNLADSGNLIEDVWEGRKPLGESFWLYYFILNGIISFGAGFLAEMNDNNIFLIAALISNIWAGVGTWNSSTNYQVQKIKTKQPYGWAYGAKILIVLNFLTISGQAILLFNL